MADMMNPQTPPRKLFKPSSKTKTPTPVKRQRPTTPAPSSTQSHDIFTPTETISRSTEGLGALETTQGAIDSPIDENSASERTALPTQSIADKPRELLNLSASDLPEPSNPTDALNSPVDIAKYFADQGNLEMSTFVSALAGKDSNDETDTLDESAHSNQGASGGATETMSGATDDSTNEASEPMKELPRDDTLVVPPNGRTEEALSKTTGDITEKASDFTDLAKDSAGDSSAETTNINQNQNITENTPNIPKPADVSKEAEGVTSDTKEQTSGAAPINNIGEPDMSSISKEAHVGLPNGKGKLNDDLKTVPDSVDQKSGTSTPEITSDGTRVADNMGKPAHIERRIEIPLPRPEKVVKSPPTPTQPDINNIATGLTDPNDLPSTQALPSTDDLQEVPDDTLQDPPEEILDPSVHSPSNISPIPSIPKIAPIGMAPPPDLPCLAHGLGGNMVDDVGNIVDEAGKVLGHATGDLPAMVGKRVADNGEVYGESGEVIGYVSENFTGPPPPADIPSSVLGGLKVDHEGNILDNNGNIIGRFNEKAGENGGLPPFMKRSKTGESQTESDKTQGEEKKQPKVNAHTGGSPSDIFLDVKSTTDGIQLTIRIPTTFGRQPQDSQNVNIHA